MLKSYLVCLTLTLGACASSFEQPRNIDDMQVEGYFAQRQSMSERDEFETETIAAYQNLARCQSVDLAVSASPSKGVILTQEPELLSPGDLVRVQLPHDDRFSGDFIIAPSGYLRLPYLGDLPAAGGSMSELEHNISRLLVTSGYFKAAFAEVSVSVLQWAPIQVTVSGAVFQAGDTVLNRKRASDDPAARIDAEGDIAMGRQLSSALAGAGGVRPDADIQNIVLVRAGRRKLFDMTGSLDGSPIEDPILVAGDSIHVLSRGCFQAALARPSRITPPGIRVFMSNLTQPSASNASSAINTDSTRLPYGTRFLQGLVSANCVGGIQATNARRWGVLISQNPVTGKSEVISRSIEDLVRRADRDDFNPLLLPNDAIACYDSHVTNLREVISTFTSALSPLTSVALIQDLTR